MTFLRTLPLLLATVLLQACERDDTRPTVNPTIEFRTEAGYTFNNATVTVGDTLLVGVVIKRGTDAMNHFKVARRYDNGPEEVTDSLSMGTDVFEFDKTIVIRDVPGTELWRFNVVENDGDVIRRSLTFTVEE
ncbi:MAG: hypothetical protein KIT10_12040 [Flavobacteriales bacterium]|nr:hypothetical protein [Flavobacteriales bacterium]